MNTMNQPTPETDAAEKLFGELPGLCHRLERERDDEKLAHEFTATAYKLMREERDQLREQLRQYDDAAQRAADERCTADEHHCACVPLLREQLRLANEDANRLAEQLKSYAMHFPLMDEDLAALDAHCERMKGEKQ